MTVGSPAPTDTPAACAMRALERVRARVRCDGAALMVMDPVTRLFNTGAVDGLPAVSCHPFFTFELTDAPRTFRRMAVERTGASSVSAEEDPHDALLATVLLPHGFGAELRAVCVDAQVAWGGITLWRATGSRPFAAQDRNRLDARAGELAHDLRDAVVSSLASSTTAVPGGAPFGVIVLERGEVVETSPEVRALLAELANDSSDEYLHIEHLRALASGPLPFSTVLRTPGGWLTAHGARLGADKVAVSLATAGPDRLLGAKVAAARLSARELEVTRLICRGLSDREIARELGVSAHTAHDHVRAVRRKLDARSRAEVSATIFAEQYFEGFLATAAVSHSG